MESTTSLFNEILSTYGLAGLTIAAGLFLLGLIIYKLAPRWFDSYLKRKEEIHNEKMNKGLQNAPKIYKLLRQYREQINADHVFVAEFHNGSVSSTGIPYMKFDIIYEHMCPKPHEGDTSFIRLYESEHLLSHDQAPDLLFQNHLLNYEVDDLAKVDETTWYRLKSRGAKYFAASLTRDKKGNPLGFLGVVNFENEINVEALKEMTEELEKIYNV